MKKLIALALFLAALAWLCPTHLYIADGDSLTAGDKSSSYPSELRKRLGLSWFVRNYGVPSQTLLDMSADAHEQIDGWRFFRTKVLGAWAGTNDIYFGATGQEAFARYVTYARARTGWPIIAFTMLPRSNPGTPPEFERERQVFNALVRQHWREFAVGLADVAATLSDERDERYFKRDRVHLNASGDRAVADIVNAEIRGRAEPAVPATP